MFKAAGETAPSAGKIIGFMKRRGITLQAIKDTKKKSKESLLDVKVKTEPVADPFRAPLVKIGNARNIQKEVFEDRRVTIEDFLKSM